MQLRLLLLFACLSSLFAPAASAQQCLTAPQIRALTVALADIAAASLVKHCSGLEGADSLYMQKNGAALVDHLNPLRAEANGILIDKYAPFLSRRPEMAANVVDSILATMADQFAISDLDLAACQQTDGFLEALHALPPAQTADFLTVLMRRQSELDQNAWITQCAETSAP